MLKASLQLRLGQQLTMTPQLQQAIRLLQLPTLELQAHIRELLETNVMLEQDEESETAASFEPLARPTGDGRRAGAPAPSRETASVEVVDDGWTRPRRRPAENPWNAGRRRRASRNSPTQRGEIAARSPAVAAGAGAPRRARAGHRPRDHRCHQRRRLPHRPARGHRRHAAPGDRGRRRRSRRGARDACRRSIRPASARASVSECLLLQLRAARSADAGTGHRAPHGARAPGPGGRPRHAPRCAASCASARTNSS